MKRIIREKVNEVIDIEKYFIEHNIDYRRASEDLWILCPFHKEKTPSCSVSPVMRVFHCFGCNTKGDLVFLISKFSNKSIKFIIDEYCVKYNISFPKTLNAVGKKPICLTDDDFKLIDIELHLDFLYEMSRLLFKTMIKFAPFSEFMKLYYDTEVWIEYYELCREELINEKKYLHISKS